MVGAIRDNLHRIGAVFYILWGLLHIVAAYISYQLGAEEATGFAQGKLFQNAWNLAYLSVFCIAIAVIWNWKNSLTGYWLNLATISITDIGFLVLIYAPGYSTDLLGPVLWLLGAAFTTAAIMTNPRTR